jgi:hypothetical protein
VPSNHQRPHRPVHPGKPQIAIGALHMEQWVDRWFYSRVRVMTNNKSLQLIRTVKLKYLNFKQKLQIGICFSIPFGPLFLTCRFKFQRCSRREGATKNWKFSSIGVKKFTQSPRPQTPTANCWYMNIGWGARGQG